MTKEEIAWDLSGLFTGYDDPKIDKLIENSRAEVDQFIKDYKGKIKSPEFSAEDLNKLFQRQEEFEANLDELQTFAYILYDANMQITEHEALKNKTIGFLTEVNQKLTFLELEVGKFVFENKALLNDPKLNNYKHYLEKTARAYPHLLSELEEQLILEKDQFGVNQWNQLQGKWLNTRQFHVMVEGEEKILSYGEANSLLTHPDRNTRISTNKSIYATLGKEEILYSTTLRNIFSDWLKIVERRKYESPMHHSLIANDTTQEIIDSLMKTMEENAGIYQRYLTIKAKILGYPILSCADVHAPLPNSRKKSRTWNETKELILEAYRNFDESFETYALDMFEKKHIDATVRKGKRNGAYCDTWYNGKSCYILLSFTGSLREIYTLAHELGHAIHGYMASREQTVFNLHPGASVAETASIFGELLLTDLLLSKADSVEEKKAILAQVLDEAGQAAFQVSSRVWFEQSLYDAIKNKEALDGKSISNYWITARDKIYGGSVDWFEEMDWEWAMKGHYYIPNFRFYNYPYVYAQLFVYALYQKYKTEGKNFIPKFKKLLKAGGSLSPEELGKIMDLDITKPDFWKLGIKQYEEFVNQLEELIK